MLSTERKRGFLDRGRQIATIVLLAMTMVGLMVVAADADDATVTTGKDDYSANELVDMYGSSFEAEASYSVVVVRPDGSAALYASSDDGLHGELLCYDADATDGSECSQAVTSDVDGAWTNLYQLDGISGEYRIDVYAGDGSLAATTTFWDAGKLFYTGSDGQPHPDPATEEDLGSVSLGSSLVLTCPRGTGLTFTGTNFGTAEVVAWSIHYASNYGDAAILDPLTTLTPSSGSVSAADPTDCIAVSIATGTLTPGTTYRGDLVITTQEAGPKSRDVKYFFRFTVRPAISGGGKTIGFWQNKNGQAIIKAGSSTAGACNSGTWLRQFAPFQNLSATASCSQVATYVTNVIKAATSKGSSMNPMLKAQMLATALDVYFSDPALGGNRIGAPAPIGGQLIDLTHVCVMLDGSGGSATCSGVYRDSSPAFGGATSLRVGQMLAYAASRSNAGGSVWYGNVKATQELAKDAFDAINNNVALAP